MQRGVLPGGTDISFNSPEQLKDAPAFVRMNLQALAAALGLPEHLLSGDLTNANFSSLRAGLIPFRARVEQSQYGTLAPQLLRPIWRRWLALEVLSGRVELSPEIGAEWIMPRPLQGLDPIKEYGAIKEALALGPTRFAAGHAPPPSSRRPSIVPSTASIFSDVRTREMN